MVIQFFSHPDGLGWTGFHTESTPFALVLIHAQQAPVAFAHRIFVALLSVSGVLPLAFGHIPFAHLLPPTRIQPGFASSPSPRRAR
jgi:hypothetical protein